MPTNTLVFKVQDRDARAGFSRIRREVDALDSEFKDTRSETERAGQAIDRLGNEARESAREVDRLGDAARRNNSVWQDANGRLRDARDRFVGAGQGTETLTRSLGGLKGVFAGLGIAVAAREALQFGAAAVQAAGAMEGLRRGLQAIEGSNADERLRDFNEIAKLPGLNTPQIIRYSNSLRSAGATAAEVDQIIISFGQAIVGLGGSAADTSRAMLQLTQAFGENKISQENFSTIKELIPSFNRLSKEVYGTDGSMDDLNKTFQASGQTLGQFLLPVLARLREEIPAAPVDSYARSVDALGEEFQQLKIVIGDALLPVVSSAARGFAELFDNITNFIQNTNDAKQSVEGFTNALNTATTAGTINKAFQDRIAFLEQEKAALDAAAEGRANYFRFRGRDTQAGQRYKEITTELERLQAAQGNIAAQSQYLQNVQSGLVTQARTLRQEITELTNEIDGRTGKAVQGLNRRLREKKLALAETQTQLATNANALRALASANIRTEQATEQATTHAENFSLTLAKLRATAEDTYETLSNTPIFSQDLTPNFQAAIAASNAYYAERIRQAETALAAEEAGTEEYNNLETRIFGLRRQRLQEEDRLQQALYQNQEEATRRRIAAETKAIENTGDTYREYRQILNSVIEIQQSEAFLAYINRLREQGQTFEQIVPQAREYLEFLRQIAAIPDVGTPDAQYRNFTSNINSETQDATTNVRNLVDTLLALTGVTAQLERLDLDARIPDPGVRQQQIDDQIAARNAQGGQTLGDIQIDAYQEGLRFIRNSRQQENTAAERELQASLQEQERNYRQFASTVSSLFTGIVTGRIQGFEEVARQFIAQSLRIIARAFIEFQIQKRLDDTLTASKIANQQKINAAQQASGLAGIGGIPGLGSLGNLGGFFSGGAGALGVAGLLFPNQSSNLLSGIKDEISGFLSNVAEVPDRAFAPQQIFLKIGENETREITDMQAGLRQEARV